MTIHTDKTDFMDKTDQLIQMMESRRTFWGDLKGFIMHPIDYIEGTYFRFKINRILKNAKKKSTVIKGNFKGE